jgi:hypothetical protein
LDDEQQSALPTACPKPCIDLVQVDAFTVQPFRDPSAAQEYRVEQSHVDQRVSEVAE